MIAMRWIKFLFGADRSWESVPRSNWPAWIVKGMTHSRLRATWEGKRVIVMNGKTFQYRIIPAAIAQGHVRIGG